jgi:hypothetical protein
MLTLFAAYSPGIILALLAAGVAIGAVGGLLGIGGGVIAVPLLLELWVGLPLPERARAALAIPAGHAPVTAFALGFPGPASMLPEKLAEREGAARARRPAETMLFRGSWDTAL